MAGSDSYSDSSSISVGESIDEHSVHSTLSVDPRLNDHRHQSMSLPVRTDSRLIQEQQRHQQEFHSGETNKQPPTWKERFLGKSKKNVEDVSKSPHSLGPTETQDVTLQVPTVTRPKSSSTSSQVSSNRDKYRGDGPLPHPLNPMVNSRELRRKMLSTDEDGEEDEYAAKFQDRYGSMPTSGILLASGRSHRASVSSAGDSRSKHRKSSASNHSSNIVTILDPARDVKMHRVSSHASSVGSNPSTDESDGDIRSHGSRDSQETEEDVCFPMVPKHVRVRGIDFDEIEEFITEQRQQNEQIVQREKELQLRSTSSITTSSENFSTAALKYTPRFAAMHHNDSKNNCGSDHGSIENEKKDEKNDHKKNPSSTSSSSTAGEKDNFESSSAKVSFESIPASNDNSDAIPDRFSFFNSAREATIHCPDIPSMIEPGHPVRSLFEPDDCVWWLDCVCPTDDEMKMLAKAFGIHPLTAEDIRMQEAREKVELFRTYYFVCFHTFDPDSESEDFLEPINVYMVVFKQGMLTFHFTPITNPANVRRRVRQLRDYVDVSADWLCYAMIDDITDGFAPVIHSIEYEADAIEDSVFLSRENDFRTMLFRIGESRRKVMTLMRLLQGKADVIKMFSKRCHEDTSPLGNQSAQPRADIALYLGDIQDHIITMFQSLLSYEKIFSRSHSNYLAQLQLESFYSNNQVTDMLSKVTLIGTILVPMNLVTGLFGMNVLVPGQDTTNYGWFGGILGFIIVVVLVSGFAANWYMDRTQRRDSQLGGSPSGVSMRSFGFGRRNNVPEQQHDRTNRSVVSSRFSKYGEWGS